MPSYYSNYYVKKERWTELWCRAMDLDYMPSVKIQAVKPKRDGDDTYTDAVLETAKYAVKDADYIRKSDAETDKVVAVLADALHGRRLIGFGGLFRKIRAELKQPDLESADVDLTDADKSDCKCPICLSDLQDILYRWDFLSGQYLREDNKE
jgi:plasmid rolling circle replication initiator protein Rep